MDQRFDITFDKVARAAEIYFVEKASKYRRYWCAYQRVNSQALRDRLLYDPDGDSLDKVIGFLNNWRCRLNYEAFRPVLCNALKENSDQISSIYNDHLESSYLDQSKMGPTVASKVLAVLSPGLFVRK